MISLSLGIYKSLKIEKYKIFTDTIEMVMYWNFLKGLKNRKDFFQTSKKLKFFKRLKKKLAYNFLFWWYLCLILVLRWWWLYKMSLGVFFTLLGKFKKDGCECFVCLVEFTCEAIWSRTFVCRECFYYIFNFISSDWSVPLICFFLIQFWRVVCLQKVVHFFSVVKFVDI